MAALFVAGFTRFLVAVDIRNTHIFRHQFTFRIAEYIVVDISKFLPLVYREMLVGASCGLFLPIELG